MNTASAIEWVTSSAVVPDSAQIRSSSRFIRCRVISSSAPNGSSSSSMSGCQHQRAGDRDALLHAARQRVRQRVLESPQADQLDQIGGGARRAPGAPAADHVERQLDILGAPYARAAASGLEHEAQRMRMARRARRFAAERDGPANGCITSATSRSKVDLPQPLGPMIAPNRPAGTCMSTFSSAMTGSPRP